MADETNDEKWKDLIAPFLVLLAAVIFVKWIYLFYILSFGVVLIVCLQKVQNFEVSESDKTPDNHDTIFTIQAPLQDPQFLAQLDDAQKKWEQFIRREPRVQARIDKMLRDEENAWIKQQRFESAFPLWKISRTNTVESLIELRKNLDSVCVTANCIKAGGNVLGILGGGGCMLASAFPALAPAAVTCAVLKVAGDVLVPTTTMIENVLNEEYIDEIKSVFRKDAVQSKKILEWFSFLTNLDRHFEEVFYCSFRTSSLDELGNNIDGHIEGLRYMGQAIEIGKLLQRGGIFNERNEQMIRSICINMEKIKRAYTNPRIFQICKSAIQMIVAFNGLGYVDNYASGLTLLALKYALPQFNLGLNNDMGLAVQCLNEIPNITMHALSLKAAIKTARQGESKYSAPMKELEAQLGTELRVLTTRFQNRNN